MSAYIGDFKRKEIKYQLSAAQADRFVQGISGHMRLDEYGATQVNSLYLDTPQRDLIERSLEKPLYKEKLRLRWYGNDLEDETPVFLELKKKYKGIVYKRRIRLTYRAAQAFIYEGIALLEACAAYPLEGADQLSESERYAERQIAREIEAFCARHYPLVPSMLITCVRSAYAPIVPDGEDQGLRITFDAELQYKDLFSRSYLKQLLPSDRAVMEIKVSGAYPLWLARLLGDVGIKPSSFSKYGRAYLDSGSEEMKKYA